MIEVNQKRASILSAVLDEVYPDKGYGAKLVEGMDQCEVKRGPRKGGLKRTPPKFGTVGYIFYQAFVSASNAYRMPSQFCMLFNKEEADLFHAFHDVLIAYKSYNSQSKESPDEKHYRALKEVSLRANV